MKVGEKLLLLICLLGSASTAAQESSIERINASRIQAKGHSGSNRIRLGLPEKTVGPQNDAARSVHFINALASADFSERISSKDRVWTSWCQETKLPNWIAREIDFTAIGKDRDCFTSHIPKGKFNVDKALWQAFINEIYRWGWEKPEGQVTVIVGPLVSKLALQSIQDINPTNDSEIQTLEQVVPYGWFAVVCKKVKSVMGWKSIGFIFPNEPIQSKNLQDKTHGLYDWSMSVNAVELKSGYNFFKKLPLSVQEIVEEMTVAELFCPVVENEEELEMSEENNRELDLMDLDVLEEMRNEMIM